MAGTAQGQAGPWGSGECAVVADVPADRRRLEWMAVNGPIPPKHSDFLTCLFPYPHVFQLLHFSLSNILK